MINMMKTGKQEGEFLMNRKWMRWVVIVMLVAMLFSTLSYGLAYF